MLLAELTVGLRVTPRVKKVHIVMKIKEFATLLEKKEKF